MPSTRRCSMRNSRSEYESTPGIISHAANTRNGCRERRLCEKVWPGGGEQTRNVVPNEGIKPPAQPHKVSKATPHLIGSRGGRPRALNMQRSVEHIPSTDSLRND